MKLFLRKKIKVYRRNIFGIALQYEERCYIYKWTWKGRQYLRIRVCDDRGPVFGTVDSGILNKNVVEVWCTWISKFKEAHNYSKQEADFILKDVRTQPDKYILKDDYFN